MCFLLYFQMSSMAIIRLTIQFCNYNTIRTIQYKSTAAFLASAGRKKRTGGGGFQVQNVFEKYNRGHFWFFCPSCQLGWKQKSHSHCGKCAKDRWEHPYDSGGCWTSFTSEPAKEAPAEALMAPHKSHRTTSCLAKAEKTHLSIQSLLQVSGFPKKLWYKLLNTCYEQKSATTAK